MGITTGLEILNSDIKINNLYLPPNPFRGIKHFNQIITLQTFGLALSVVTDVTDLGVDLSLCIASLAMEFCVLDLIPSSFC